MTSILATHWRSLAVRGVLSILIGLIAFIMPVATLVAITILFGAYALLDGIVYVNAAVRSARQGEHWWELLFVGAIGLIAAVVTFVWPRLTLLALVYVIAAWAVLTGVLEIAAAIRLRRQIRGEWLLVLAGIASIAFGVLLFGAPGPGALVLAWWVGAYIFAMGVLMLALAFRLRRWSTSIEPGHA